MKKLILLCVLSSVVFFGSVVYVHGQIEVDNTSPTSVPSTLKQDYPGFIYSESSQGISIADVVSRFYTYALGIAGILAIIMIVYGGLSYALQPGNTSKQKEALDIMQSAVWGIVLLVGAYVILRTINPDLVTLRNPGFQKISDLERLDLGGIDNDTGSVVGGTAIGCTNENTDMQKNIDLAKEVVNLGVRTQANPQKNLDELKSGRLPTVCDGSGGACNTGGVSEKKTICPTLLEGIKIVQTKANTGTIPRFTITSITTGTHHPNSAHYQGRGLDVIVQGNTADWTAVIQAFNQAGANAKMEYKEGDVSKFANNVADAFKTGTSNQHIHMTFGGAGSPSSEGVNLIQELKTLANKLLDLNPRIYSLNNSLGYLPSTPQNQCTMGSPLSTIRYVAQGQKPVVCDKSRLANTANAIDDDEHPIVATCACVQGGQNGNVTLSKNLLQLLIDMQKAKNEGVIPDFMISSLTGGIQINENGSPSNHYSGAAVDIIPVGDADSDWEKIETFVKNKGYTPYYESFKRTGGDYITYNFTNDYSDAQGCGTYYDNGITSLLSTMNLPKATCYFGRMHIIAHPQ